MTWLGKKLKYGDENQSVKKSDAGFLGVLFNRSRFGHTVPLAATTAPGPSAQGLLLNEPWLATVVLPAKRLFVADKKGML